MMPTPKTTRTTSTIAATNATKYMSVRNASASERSGLSTQITYTVVYTMIHIASTKCQ